MLESGRAMNKQVTLEAIPITGKLQDLQPLEITIVNKTELEPLWDYMVQNYHYLGYTKMIGPRIKYLVRHNGIPIAALSYNRASLWVGVRDVFIGWSDQEKKQSLCHVVNNNRFLILPWVRVKNLASHLLSRTIKLLKHDWLSLYGGEVYCVETFVDKDRYNGTCYYAANWQYLGETKGFSKIGKSFVYHGNRKGVFLYVLRKKFVNRNLNHRIPKRCERVPNMMLHTPDWSPDLLEQAGIGEVEVAQLGERLEQYLSIFNNCYQRSDQRKYGETFVKGLLSNLDRKSIEPIALKYMGEKGVRTMQMFFRDSPWDDLKMLGNYQQRLSDTLAAPGGMLNTDESDFVKKGNGSVGVARQYCGRLGKTENCQAGVFVGYTSDKGYGLVDYQLYMPEVWFNEEHEQLRRDCEVPEDLAFKTKVTLAQEMIANVALSGLFPATWIGCDSFFGRNKEFLASLPEGYHYFADIPENTLVWLEMPEVCVPKSSGRGRKPTRPQASSKPISVSDVAKDKHCPWKQVILGEGAKGPIVAEVKCLRVIEAIEKEPGLRLPYQEVWLYIRRYADGKIKYAFSNAPLDSSLEALNKVATMRWPIEQCFEECKSHLGMGHYETRTWRSWYRHMLFVLIAHLFVTELRLLFKKNTYFNDATG